MANDTDDGSMLIDFVSAKNPGIVIDTWYEAYHVPRVGEYVQIRDVEHRVVKTTWFNRTFAQIAVQPSSLQE